VNKMSIKVLTYKNPYGLKSLKELQAYKNCIFINATKSLNEGMRRYYSEHFNGPQISAGLFVSSLLKEWSNAETKLTQYTSLTEIIDSMRNSKSETRTKKIMKSFRRNQMEVLSTMRILTEIGVTPNNFRKKGNLHLEEGIFAQLWNQLEKSNPLFKETRDLLDLNLSRLFYDKNQFYKVLRNMLIDEKEKQSLNNQLAHTIVLHGFYFITPLQHRIFTLMKNAGFNLIFINFYDERYPETFRVIERFINKECGWLDVTEWLKEEIETPESLGKAFLAAFEDGFNDNGIGELKQKGYDDFHDFLTVFDHDLERETHTYLTPSMDDYKNRLKDYYPHCFDSERHLLSYPVGQFLFHLHKMWDETEEQSRLIISEQELYECFTSGWLIDPNTNTNARNYADKLHEILPFYGDCETIEEWIARSEELAEIHESVIGSFENEVDDIPGTSRRFHQMMRSPFSRFSHFNVEKETLKQVGIFIVRLRDIAYELFRSGDEKITLKDHFNKLEDLLFTEVDELTFNEEKKIIKFLKERLNMQETSHRRFYIKDLSEAIALYLGGSFDNPDNEDEKLIKKGKIIDKFDSLDGAILTRREEAKVLHICGLDENSLPQAESVLPWPLSRETIDYLSERNISLSMITRREQSKGEISRYLFYLFLLYQGPQECSWLKSWNKNQGIKESFYLMVLEDKVSDLNLDRDDDLFKENSIVAAEFSVAKAVEQMLKWPADALAELIYCPRRFYYSFVTSPYATYRKDFHQEFLYGHLIKASKVLTSETDQYVHDQVKDLFPQWSDLKKKLLTEENLRYVNEAKKIHKRKSLMLDGINYSALQQEFQFLNLNDSRDDESIMKKLSSVKDVHSKASIVEDSQVILREQKEYLNMQAEPSHLCRYCPHLDICPDGYYSVDDELRKME